MTYVDNLPTALASIGQIQSTFASLSAGPSSSGFEGVLQQISAITDMSAQPGLAASTSGGADLSGSYGWPLEEGETLPGANTSQDDQDQDLNAANSMAPVTRGAASTGFASATLGSGSGAFGTGSGTFGTGSGTFGSVPTNFGSSSAGLGSGSTVLGSGAAGSSTAGLSTLGSSTAGSTTTGLALPGDQSSVAGNGSSAPADLGQEAVSEAQKFLGVPYLWGGTNPAQGVDCSGLVQDVYGEVGIDLPRTSQEQALVGQAVPSLADAQPGDLVFYPGSDGTATAPGHVGIYIGNGEMIDAPYTGTDVQVDPVGDPVAIRRVTGLATSAPATAPSDTASSAGASEASTGAPSAYQAYFASAASTYSVPQQLLSAVASTESSDQPGAVSGAGAEGLMQLMPSVASSLGVNPFDPQQAVDGAARLLSSYHGLYGSWSLALAAYNAGPGAVDQYSGIPPYPQTQAYVQNVLTQAGMEDQ